MRTGETGIRKLYAEGKYLQAWREARAGWGPVAEWHRGPDPAIAGCLAANLGGLRWGWAIHLRAGRASIEDPEIRYFYTLGVLQRRGALAAWELLRKQPTLVGASAEVQADWIALRAMVSCAFRDFAASETLLDEAEVTKPDYPWLMVQRAMVQVAQDRVEDAWHSVERGLELQPWSRPVVQMAVSVLLQRDRGDEALALLEGADQRLESSIICEMKVALLQDRGEYAAARIAIERFAQLAPLRDREERRWLWRRRSDLAYLCGDIGEAKQWAREIGDPVYTSFAERLEEIPAEGRKRRLLPVSFIRQHHMTCAPATLAALCRYWSMPGEHLEMAEEICYAGTPWHRERHWAETHGFCTREFSMDWETSVALIDRGIPFTLTTVDPGNAHLQAVVGYDTARRSLLVRDSNVNFILELDAGELIQRYRANGPRGMVMVPEQERSILEELPLPDAPHYDRHHLLHRQLQDHRRDEAAETLAAQEEVAPEHLLTLTSQLAIALYDANVPRQLAVAGKLIERFPEDLNLVLFHLNCAAQVTQRAERITRLRKLCEAEGAGPVLWPLLAEILADDARERDEALDLAHRALRRRPSDARCCLLLANIHWSRREFEKAYELYRFAACLDDKEERFTQLLFDAGRYLGRGEELLELLRQRVRQLGSRSSLPAGTLAQALIQVGRMDEAFSVLEEALGTHAADPDLQLLAAGIFSRFGAEERATQLLEDARGISRSAAWRRTAAAMAARQGQLADALEHWRAVLRSEPLAIDAHRAVAELLIESGSSRAGLTHLREASAKHPFNIPLRVALIESLRGEEHSVREEAVRDLLAIEPEDAWARRELVIALVHQRRLDEARIEMEIARELDPDSPMTFNIEAALHEAAGHPDRARACLRRSIHLTVDDDNAISRLVGLADDRGARREALREVAEELRRQVTFGSGVFAWHSQATGLLEPGEILETLRDILAEREDLWPAWSATVDQLREMNLLEEAEKIAREATARFPLVARLWLDLADVHGARDSAQPEAEALRRSLRIDPDLEHATARLALTLERLDQMAEACAVVDEALARRPRSPLLGTLAAELRWRSGERGEALDRIQRTLEINPAAERAWELLGSWAAEERQPELAAELARKLTREREREVRSWLILASTLSGFEHLDERLRALDRALALDPESVEACDSKAIILAQAHRFDEARAVCRDPRWGERPPLILRGRDAWIDCLRGRITEAADALEALVEEEPRYEWGWSLLCRTGSVLEDHERFDRCADSMILQLPASAEALIWRAEIRLREEDREGAVIDLERAAILAPDRIFASQLLFDLHLEAERFEEATRVLERAGPHLGRAVRVLWRIRLAASEGRHDSASTLLRDLCMDSTADPEDLAAATQVLCQRGATDAVVATLREVLHDHRTHPACGRILVATLSPVGQWIECETVIQTLSGDPERWTLAASEFLENTADADQHATAARFIEKNTSALQRHAATWGAAGYAFLAAGHSDRVVSWMRGWKRRDGLKPWMLLNLVVANHVLRHHVTAGEIGRHALSLDPDRSTMHHATWLAHEAAIAGELITAQKLMDQVDTSIDDAFYRFLIELAQALLASARSPRRELAAARAHLAVARQAYPEYRKGLLARQCWRRTVAAIGRRAGLAGRLWSLWVR